VRLPLNDIVEGMTSKAVSQLTTVHQEASTGSRPVSNLLREFAVQFNLNFKKLRSTQCGCP